MMMGAPMQAGLLLGRAIHNLFSGNAGMVIASRQKNRRRYTCQSIKGEREVCAILEQLIADFPGIKTVTVNQITGSITVTYEQDEEYIDALFDALSHHLAGKHAVQERTIIPTRMLTVSDNINDSLRYAKKKVAYKKSKAKNLNATEMYTMNEKAARWYKVSVKSSKKQSKLKILTVADQGGFKFTIYERGKKKPVKTVKTSAKHLEKTVKLPKKKGMYYVKVSKRTKKTNGYYEIKK